MTSPPVKKPNIVIFNPDQMRADALGHLGNPAAVTPNFDKFLKDAVSFKNAYCQNPVCVPSRCSFLTGWYPHTRGHRTMYHMLHEDEPVLFKYLRDNDYYVWLNLRNDFLPAECKHYYSEIADEVMGVKIKHRGRRNRVGSKWWMNKARKIYTKLKNRVLQSPGSIDDELYYSFLEGKLEEREGLDFHQIDTVSVELAKQFIKKRSKNQPFCVFLGLMAPHPPYGVEDPYYTMIDKSKLPQRISFPENPDKLPSMMKGLRENQHLQSVNEDTWDEIRAVYLGMVAKVDHLFGKLVQTLKEEGEYDNTAIFVMSDHGDYTGDYGIVEKSQNTFQDCLVNVPLMIKPPKGYGVEPGVREALVELIDFYATVENYADFKSEHTHFGKSLQPVIETSSSDIHRDAVFCEGGRMKEENQCKEVRSDPELDPRGHYYPRLKLQRSDNMEHTKATMIRTDRYKYVRRYYETDELYDLKEDPQEIHNRIGYPEMKDILQDLRNRMLEYYQATCDTVPHKENDRMGRFDLRLYLKVYLQMRKMKKRKKKN
ncbi:MAG: sulfatase-like hydrolase/transferase [Promethearchaeota archaeon]